MIRLIVVTVSTVKPTASKSTEEFEGPFKPAKTLKQGSVLDLLKAPGESPKTFRCGQVHRRNAGMLKWT